VAVSPLLLVAEQGRTWGWTSGASWACYIVGAVGIAAFIIAERLMGDDALIPLKLFRSPTFSMATVLGVMVGFGMFGALSTIPLYLQIVKGSTPTESGFQLLPMILGLMISSIVSGQLISRTGRYKIFPILGTAFMSLGFLVFTTIKADTNYWILGGGMLLVGLGLGQMMQTLTIASQNAVGPRDIGVATSSSTFFRQVGGTLGVAVIFSVVFSTIGDTIKSSLSTTATLRAGLNAALNPAIAGSANNKAIMSTIWDSFTNPLKLAAAAQHLDLSNAGQRAGFINAVLPSIESKIKSSAAGSSSLDGDTSFLNNASYALKAPFLTGFSEAMVVGFWVSLAVVAVAFVLTFFLKATPLRQKSALQEVADADEAILATRAANTLSSGLAPDLDTARIPVVAGAPEPEPAGSK
jgi:hypothetical protein